MSKFPVFRILLSGTCKTLQDFSAIYLASQAVNDSTCCCPTASPRSTRMHKEDGPKHGSCASCSNSERGYVLAYLTEVYSKI